jgi:cell division protein FtsW
LPFAESDFILSVIGEEVGLIGVLLLVGIFLFIVVKGFMIARSAKDRFSCYVATGISAVVAVQTALNIAVVCGAIPPTGLPLPFMSAGGSSLVAYLMALGILMNISRQSRVSVLTLMNSVEMKYVECLTFYEFVPLR